ncbi:Glycosyltransferase involved in cell wall bisynthesis [Psychroflexus salarius]|uniref:Glycosyltransferase involved in cell wall bisynthesis n=1 Tax=Psychroflexus salarius TaxID=1155689 RepID=A0A1M4X3B7_9FLAO|nr:glycosyltransferase family 4 protein [Psychroflexus salarius]SHE87917.1 Glycosyltransferase involved in cell wall bisynthesis [Psychroflexus salarius]
MKIAYLTPEYPHPQCNHSAGIGTSIYNLGNALINLGHEVRVLVYGQDQDEVFSDNGIILQKIKNVKVKGISRWLTQKKIEKIINVLYADNKIDLVESIDWGGITSFIQPKKCPIVIKLHGSDTYFCKLETRHLKKKNYYHEKRALKKADAHLAVSDFVAQKTNHFFGLDLNFTTVYNGIDLTSFKEISINETSDQLLYVGTLIRKKGVLDLAHIFNEVVKLQPKAELVLIGSDASDIRTGQASTWKLMTEIFSEQALKNVHYQGKVAYDEVKTYIAKASVCVFPSYAEAFPVSWLEAMAMKKAIVASNIGWAKEVIENGSEGFLIHPSDHQLFAEKINTLLINQPLRKKQGRQAQEKIIKDFSHTVIAQKNLDFYNSIIENQHD